MFYFLGLLLFITLVSSQSSGVPNGNKNASKDPSATKVKVDLYYETHCPDCVKYESSELAPTMKKLGSYIDLYTYPFGKAKMHQDGDTITFTCQHGEKECYGNKLHACAIEKLGRDRALEYNECMMAKKSNDEAADECANQLKQYSVNADLVKSCAKSSEGDQLLKRAGDETAKIRNLLKSVPCVFINGNMLGNSPKSSDELASLTQAVCAALEEQPAACKEDIAEG